LAGAAMPMRLAAWIAVVDERLNASPVATGDAAIDDSSPDSAIRLSPRFSAASGTDMTLPMTLASMATPLIGVGSR
jgi:hypothetical protein